MKWGLRDTKDNLWMGNDDGPLTYDSETLAKVAAITVDVMLRQAPGRTRATEWLGGPVRLRDEKVAAMTPAQALDRYERGGF